MSLSTQRLSQAITPAADALKDRVVLITGAAGGLGSATARACARAGATVVLAGHKARKLDKLYDELVESGAPKPAIVPLNLENATPTQYEQVVDIIKNELGHLDGLVHAAAYFDALTPLLHHKPDEWLRTLQVNLSAPFAFTQACQPLLMAAPDSAVVFITDDPDHMDSAHWGAYGVAKAGLERFASILHDENDTGAMRVHLLLPGPMRTTLRRKAWFGEDPMTQPTPDATAEVVVHLLSPAGVAWRGKTLDLRPEASAQS
ncbi:MAG TPA: SDR family NAD(P)-dependent oxidoreductase [Oleiagrimonas sp.]|nr:SDR family NAD(P)-dependent oxidoreductase [Oleiagrimonas sp.]